jgi:phage gp36-like protein
MPYSVRADIEAQYGQSNVEKWADLDGLRRTATIDARIAWAIENADSYIDDRLREGPYVLPFASTPTRIKFMSARLAGVMLYESRGAVDFDADGKAQDQLRWQRSSVDRDIRDILSRRLRLDAEQAAVQYPQVVQDETIDEEDLKWDGWSSPPIS